MPHRLQRSYALFYQTVTDGSGPFRGAGTDSVPMDAAYPPPDPETMSSTEDDPRWEKWGPESQPVQKSTSPAVLWAIWSVILVLGFPALAVMDFFVFMTFSAYCGGHTQTDIEAARNAGVTAFAVLFIVMWLLAGLITYLTGRKNRTRQWRWLLLAGIWSVPFLWIIWAASTNLGAWSTDAFCF